MKRVWNSFLLAFSMYSISPKSKVEKSNENTKYILVFIPLVGAVIGFVSFIAFSIVYTPISMLLGWLIPSYTQGFLRFFMTSFGSFVVMILLMILMAGISALFNAFSGLITAYVYELITGIKKEANENNTIDFEIQ